MKNVEEMTASDLLEILMKHTSEIVRAACVPYASPEQLVVLARDAEWYVPQRVRLTLRQSY